MNPFPGFARQLTRLLLLCVLCSGLTLAQETEAAKYTRAMTTIDEAGFLFDIGSQNSFRQAIKKYQEALEILRSLNHRKHQDLIHSSIANTYERLGEFQNAIDANLSALEIRRELKDDKATALTLTHIAAAYLKLNEYRKSVDYYTQALEIWRALKDPLNEATSLANLCYVYAYDELNEKRKAIESCKESIPLWQKLNDPESEASAQYLLGLTYATVDEHEKSLESYNQALSLYRKLKDRKGEADTLHRMAMSYSLLGKSEKALDYYNLALPIFRDIKDLAALAGTLDNMALIYESSGNTLKALEVYGESLRLTRAAKDREGEGAVLGNLALAYFKIGETQNALEYYKQALALKQHFADRRLEASVLNGLGLTNRVLRNHVEARKYYLAAQTIFRQVGDQTGLANSLFNLARLDAIEDDLRASRALIEEAIAIIESLRAAISDQELRTSYFSTVQHYYDFYIEILMRLHAQHPANGHDAEALQVSERRRARALLETLAEAGADIRQGVAAELLERERTLQRQLNASAQGQLRLLSGKHSEEQARTVAKEIEALTTEFQQVEAKIRQESPNYAALTQPQPLTLKQIQTQVLDSETLLLEYSLGIDKCYLWAVTSTSITSYELPKRDEIENVARRLYDLLNARNDGVKGETTSQRRTRIAKADNDLPAAAASLSRIVLTPVAAQLGTKRLVIVTDGVLQYIPFGVLPVPSSTANGKPPATSNGQLTADTSRPLIMDHEIVSLPSASTLAVIRREVTGRPLAPKMVVAVADPVFMKSDERVAGTAKAKSRQTTSDPQATQASGVKELIEDFEGLTDGELRIARLPGSRKEAEEIVAMAPATERKLALDFAASRATATSPELGQYRYVHFSTHGFLNSVHPELSGIVFSLVNERGETQDGFLRAHEVFNLKLSADLVVLSACQTGIGKEIKGEGLVSLTRGFMYAGAPRVVVSLWSVSDAGTTELMVRFYRQMLKEGLRPAAALRAAQISLMKEGRWSSPFYWAPFTIQGEWR